MVYHLILGLGVSHFFRHFNSTDGGGGEKRLVGQQLVSPLAKIPLFKSHQNGTRVQF